MTFVDRLDLPKFKKLKSLTSTGADDLTFVIPVLNDSSGLSRTISFIETLTSSCPIVVVNDGSSGAETARIRELTENSHREIKLVELAGNYGAGFARNAGASHVSTSWIAFIDCDCRLIEGWQNAFRTAARECPTRPIAICGPVKADGGGLIPLYMQEQGILNPPMCAGAPQTIVTANAVVWREAFLDVGGFDGLYPGAGGEDTDLGFKLSQVGTLHFSAQLAVFHRFEDSMAAFSERFFRYGRANALLEDKWGGNFRPKPVELESPDFEELGSIQYKEMLRGYLSMRNLTDDRPAEWRHETRRAIHLAAARRQAMQEIG